MTSKRRELMMAQGGGGRLPPEYQEVEYIEVPTGTNAYINSGYAFVAPELKIEFKYLKTNVNTNPFGVDFGAVSSIGRMMHGHIYGNNFYTGNSGRQINFTEGRQSANIVYEGSVQIIGIGAGIQQVVLRINGGSQSVINEENNLYNGCEWTDYVLATRSGSNGSSQYHFRGRLYYLKFYDEEGVIVRDFVPCYKKSGTVIGLYDLCGSISASTNTPLYINQGTGTLQKGADVN